MGLRGGGGLTKGRGERHTHIHARQPWQPGLSWFPWLPRGPFWSLWGKGRGVRRIQWGALASPRNQVFSSSGTIHHARGACPCLCAADSTQLGSPASPSLAPGGHPSPADPYLLTTSGHPLGHVSLSSQGLMWDPQFLGPHSSVRAHLETSGQLPCGTVFLACPGTGPKKVSKPAPPRASQTLPPTLSWLSTAL